MPLRHRGQNFAFRSAWNQGVVQAQRTCTPLWRNFGILPREFPCTELHTLGVMESWYYNYSSIIKYWLLIIIRVSWGKMSRVKDLTMPSICLACLLIFCVGRPRYTRQCRTWRTTRTCGKYSFMLDLVNHSPPACIPWSSYQNSRLLFSTQEETTLNISLHSDTRSGKDIVLVPALNSRSIFLVMQYPALIHDSFLLM